MATRCYFPSTTAADVTPVANGTWNYTSESVDRKLVPTTKSNTALAEGTRIGPWTVDQLARDRRYVSPPLSGAQTISGTATLRLMTREFNNGDNSTSATEIYVVHNDGQTVRGTLFAASTSGSGSEYVNNATYRNKRFMLNEALSSVSAQNGDRIVVVIGHGNLPGSSTPEGACKFGDPTALSDLPDDETQTTDGTGFVEFSQNLTFQTSTTFPKSLLATEVSVPTFARKTSKFLSVVSTALRTIARKTSKTLTQASAGVATFLRKTSKTLGVTEIAVPVLSKARLVAKALAAFGTSAPALLAKQVIIKLLSGASTGIATLLKVLLNLKTLAATEVTVATLGRYRSFGTPFLYTAANWSGGTTFYLEVYFRAVSGTARARLYDATTGAGVAGSEITTTGGTLTLARSGAVTLVNGHQYFLQLGTTGASVGAIRGLPRLVAVSS